MSADTSSHETTGHDHAAIHLPPNSFIPLMTALALMLSLVGAIFPPIWIAGVVVLVPCLVWWVVAARREFRDLPETLD